MATAAWREAHREEMAVSQAAYRASHREKIAASQAAYRAANREKIAALRASRREKIAAYNAANREKIAAWQAAYYAAHREEFAAHNAAYRAAHREEAIAYAAAYYEGHSEELQASQAAYGAAYRPAHREQAAARAGKRRARKLENSIGFPEPDYKAILAEFGMLCHICGLEILAKSKSAGRYDPNSLHWEHILAVTQKGPEATENILPSHARCNLIKGRKVLTLALREHIKVRKAKLDLRDKGLLVST